MPSGGKQKADWVTDGIHASTARRWLSPEHSLGDMYRGSWQIDCHMAIKQETTLYRPLLDLLESLGYFMKYILVQWTYATCIGVFVFLEDFFHVQSLVDSEQIQVWYLKEINIPTRNICFSSLSIQGSSRDGKWF